MKNILIRNLSSDTRGEAIRSLFEPFGTVRKLKLMIDKSTGLSRGFAFIEMKDAEAGSAMAALDGSVLDGQILKICAGRPRLH